MPKLCCTCGHIFRLSDMPCRDQYWAVNDERFTEALHELERKPDMSGGEMHDYIFAQDREILLCPMCSRIHIVDSEDTNIYHPYISEELLYEHNIKYDRDLHLKNKGKE